MIVQQAINPGGVPNLIDVPVGKRVKIMAVQMGITPAGAGDIVVIDWLRQPATFMGAVSSALDVAITAMDAGVGLTNTAVAANVTRCQMGLPDVWMDKTFSLLPQMTSGTVDTGTIVYDVQDVRP